MGNGLLFRWEESPNLKHHCGVCGRPLSHPSARITCFGGHAEPCHRFHQHMFIRNRSHICAHCATIDEAHHKRHHEVVELLRRVYESAGEDEWTIIPSEPESCGRTKAVDTCSIDSDEIDGSATPGNLAVSRKERKEAKRLVRAASRPRLITQEEIRHVGSVLHLEDALNTNRREPRNNEEIDEIECNLRYHAHVYESKEYRHKVKRLARLPDADIDFDFQISRIWDNFRISELCSRNTNTRGLQGKELKVFSDSVLELKNLIIEDLVLVKKDELEIRMRRAGYLRYTNRASFNTVEERYIDRDWKTGERLPPIPESSRSFTPLEDTIQWPSTNGSNFLGDDDSLQVGGIDGADRRHLEQSHKKICGYGSLEEVVIQPDLDASPSPTAPPVQPIDRAPQLRIIFDKPSATQKHAPVWGHEEQDGWLSHKSSNFHFRSRVENKISSDEASCFAPKKKPYLKNNGVPNNEIARKASIEPAVIQSMKSQQPMPKAKPIQNAVTQPSTPNGKLDTDNNESAASHPPISAKKQKKKQRELKRKEKKAAVIGEQELAQRKVDVEPTAQVELRQAALEAVNTVVSMEEVAAADFHAQIQSWTRFKPEADAESAKNDVQTWNSTTAERVAILKVHNNEPEVLIEAIHHEDDLEKNPSDDFVVDGCKGSIAAFVKHPHEFGKRTLPVVDVGRRQLHWMKFTKYLIPDQLTSPDDFTGYGCHAQQCGFKDLVDCPFHKTHCACADPLNNTVYLVFPGPEISSSGPYTYLHAKKLLEIYEEHEKTKGRLMIVDEEILGYLTNSAYCLTDCESMPPRMYQEYQNWRQSQKQGPLMKQYFLFDQLWQKNATLKRPLALGSLQEIHRNWLAEKGATSICYCYDMLPRDSNLDGIIECSYWNCEPRYFHKVCVKDLHPELSSRWYCTVCEIEIKIDAEELLCKLRGKESVKKPTIEDQKKLMAEIIRTRVKQDNKDWDCEVRGVDGGGISFKCTRKRSAPEV